MQPLPQATGAILTQDSSETADTGHRPPADEALEREVAQLIVDALNLEIRADDIEAEAPLFGEGLGLDSIDILEVALVVSKRYGFQLRSDDDDNIRIFKSLRSLCQHVAQHRVK